MIKYITSVNNTHHIGLYNYKNNYCHYVAIIQRLHSSPTLNDALLNPEFNLCACSNGDIECEYIKQVMYPVYEYAKYKPESDTNIKQTLTGGACMNPNPYSNIISDTNSSESLTNTSFNTELQLYTKLQSYFETFERDFIADSGRNGYQPQYDIIFTFLPIIHKLFPAKFELILRELTMDEIDFINNETAVDDVIFGSNAFFREKYRECQKKLYAAMMQSIPSQIDRSAFCSAVLEVFPNPDNTGGHAVTLLKCKGDVYYVIDDQNKISMLEEYFRNRKARMHHISIRDIDESTVANLNVFLHAKCNIDSSCSLSKRISRYELNFDHNFVSANIQMLKPELKDISMTGGNVNTQTIRNNGTHNIGINSIFSNNYIIIMTFIMISIVMLIIGISIWYVHMMEHRYECERNKYIMMYMQNHNMDHQRDIERDNDNEYTRTNDMITFEHPLRV